MTTMPTGFFWGNSTSSMQTEGFQGVRGKSTYDLKKEATWEKTIDEYHRYPEDFDLMAEMGVNMYRFEISWARVVPDGDGEFNEAGIQFYSDMIDTLLARGIQPMIALYHFDMPLALAEKYNGFLSRHVVDAYVRYAKEIISRFADRVTYWLTFNEHNLYFTNMAYDIGGAIDVEHSLDNLYQIFHHTMLAHAHVANFVHEQFDQLQIGGMLAYQVTYPATSKPTDVFAARRVDTFLNDNLLTMFTAGHYLPEVLAFVATHNIDMDYQPKDDAVLSKQTSDFIAFSYYRTDMLNADKIPDGTAPNRYLDIANETNPYLTANEWSWTIDPLGFRNALTSIYSRYQLPVFPVENGLGWREEMTGDQMIQDDYRIQYHRDHIDAMKQAMIEDGTDVIGYLGWGLIDIPSSSGDMNKRYGAVYVNRTNEEERDMRRSKKASFEYLRDVFKSNGLNS